LVLVKFVSLLRMYQANDRLAKQAFVMMLVWIARQRYLDGRNRFRLLQFSKQPPEVGIGTQPDGFGCLESRVQIGTGLHALV
jgi:hypothetical protein